jgi:uncharacterized membrane protein
MDNLFVLAAIALLACPVLAIIALVSVRRLERDLASTPGQDPRLQELTSRVYALEQQLKDMSWRPVAPSDAEPAIASTTEILRVEVPAEPMVPSLETTASPPPPMAAGQAIPSPTSSSGVPRLGVSPGPTILHSVSEGQRAPARPDADLEDVIGGRWFNRIGIVAILIAVSYFLKLAFDNNWIGPTGRVAIGILLGGLMLPWSHWLLTRGYAYFSEGIAALGEATLFLSVWAGCQYYTLYSRDVGFAAMIAITAVMAAIAIGRDSQRVAVLSLLGGLLAPFLASSGQDQQVILFSYLFLLGVGALVLAAKKHWSSLPPIAFIGTQIYFWGWYSEFFHRTSPLERTIFFATLFFLLYMVLPVREAMRRVRAGEVDMLIVLLNDFIYAATLFALLWPDDKWPLTLFFIALAAAHVAVARLISVPAPGQSAMARLLFAGLALTYLTLAIPIRLEGKWITLSFAVEGATLVWTGFRVASNFLRQSGYLLLALSALRLLLLPPEGGGFIFNTRFAAYLVMIACFAVALWSARDYTSELAGRERVEVGIFGVAINVYALIALSAEFWDYFGKATTTMDATLARHLSLSILWTVYATALIVFGVQTKSALMRWQGLALFGLVVCKVFLYDLSFLERAYRIFSFFVLGAVLLGVSFLYQRKLARERQT